MIRDSSREFNHLLEVILDREIVGEFTSCVIRIRGKPLEIVNLELIKNDKFRTKKNENVFCLLLTSKNLKSLHKRIE